MKKVFLLLTVVVFTLQSCATMFGGGGDKDIPFTSDSDGVEVYVNGAFIGEDPATINVTAKDVVTFKKDGYKQQSIIVKGGFNAVALVNLISPATIIGFIVDAATGNITKVKTKSLNAYLKKVQENK